MNADITKAIDIFNSGKYTCVLCKDNTIYTSTERGVKPLIEWLDSDIELKDFSAADKVVGKAAALLYVLLGVKEVYAHVVSDGAAAVFTENNIEFRCDNIVQKIINRAGTGNCPMEEAVNELSDPKDALKAVRAKLIQLAEH